MMGRSEPAAFCFFKYLNQRSTLVTAANTLAKRRRVAIPKEREKNLTQHAGYMT